ncbi:MAG: hypothetical protein JNK74_22190 [Candidatus Hydrogenedentes bacterium]|nr:hypothetical protein [Candidatus Hydrogenedentota bacterium]
MPCLMILIGAFFPRVVLVLVWLTGYGARAFDSTIVPLAGFFVMPYTTLAYAIAMNEVGAVHGLGLALVIVGVVFDLGGWGGTHSGYKHRRGRG